MRRLHVYVLLEDGEPVAILSGKSKAEVGHALKARLRSSRASHYDAWLEHRGLEDGEGPWGDYLAAMADSLPEYSLERIGLGKDFAVVALADSLFGGDGYYPAKGKGGKTVGAIKAEPESPDEIAVDPPRAAR